METDFIKADKNSADNAIQEPTHLSSEVAMMPAVPVQLVAGDSMKNAEANEEKKELSNDELTERDISSASMPNDENNRNNNSPVSSYPSPNAFQFKLPSSSQKEYPAPVFQLKISDDFNLKADFGDNRSTIQKQSAEEEEIPGGISSSTSGALPNPVRSQMENALGADFSDIKVHADSQSATDVGALAYTQGNDVHFAPGQYNPETSGGQELIGHELTHVVQQRDGRVQPTLEVAGMPVNDDKSLEEEADEGGRKAAQMKLDSSRSLKVGYQGNSDSGLTEGGFDNSSPIQRKEEVATDETTANGDTLDEEIERFRNHGAYGPQGIVPDLGGGKGIGGFEATYVPDDEALFIDIRGKISFVDSLTFDGGRVKANNPKLNDLAQVINTFAGPDEKQQVAVFYQWDDTTKSKMYEEYLKSLDSASKIWNSTNYSFYIAEEGWEEFVAYPFIFLDIEEGEVEEGPIVEGQSSNLQIKVYKSPSNEELEQVKGLLNANYAAGDTSYKLNDRAKFDLYVKAYVDSDGDKDPDKTSDDNAYNGVINMSSLELLNRPENDERGSSHDLKYSVLFENNSAEISEKFMSGIGKFIDDFKDSRGNITEHNAIHLVGYASEKGSYNYNTELVNKRLAAVRDVLASKGISGMTESMNFDQNPNEISSEENRSNIDSRSMLKDEETQKKERRVEIRIGSGERQNTVAHELTHIFGMKDEYVNEGEKRPVGTEVEHDQIVKDAGIESGAVAGNNDSIASVGNQVRPQHFAVFAFALNKLTSKKWHVQ